MTEAEKKMIDDQADTLSLRLIKEGHTLGLSDETIARICILVAKVAKGLISAGYYSRVAFEASVKATADVNEIGEDETTFLIHCALAGFDSEREVHEKILKGRMH